MEPEVELIFKFPKRGVSLGAATLLEESTFMKDSLEYI